MTVGTIVGGFCWSAFFLSSLGEAACAPSGGHNVLMSILKQSIWSLKIDAELKLCLNLWFCFYFSEMSVFQSWLLPSSSCLTLHSFAICNLISQAAADSQFPPFNPRTSTSTSKLLSPPVFWQLSVSKWGLTLRPLKGHWTLLLSRVHGWLTLKSAPCCSTMNFSIFLYFFTF